METGSSIWRNAPKTGEPRKNHSCAIAGYWRKIPFNGIVSAVALHPFCPALSNFNALLGT
jgi:hypothetical protein